MKTWIIFLLQKIKRFATKFYLHILKIYNLNLVKEHKNELFIGGYTLLSKNTKLGFNPNFNGCIVNGYGNLTIGDNFHSGNRCLIITSNHNYEGGKRIPYDETIICKDVVIEDNVWIGDRVIILPGVRIGEGSVVQAGAVVVRNLEKLSISGGNPAKTFKYRNSSNYYYLKEKKLFL